MSTGANDAPAAVNHNDEATGEPLDCDALILALDECEQELEECQKSLKKAKRKNKELLEDFADHRRSFAALEDDYALVKYELAQAKTNEDTLLIATQQALADRDVIILELTRERDEAVASLKQASSERDEMAERSLLLEECLAAKDLSLLTVVGENDFLKNELKKAKRELEAAYQRVESLDMLQHPVYNVTETPMKPPPKVTMGNRWTRGFRNPLKRRSITKPADDLSLASTEVSSNVPSEDFDQ
jgi:chromosome segregation ATPase